MEAAAEVGTVAEAEAKVCGLKVTLRMKLRVEVEAENREPGCIGLHRASACMGCLLVNLCLKFGVDSRLRQEVLRTPSLAAAF